MSEPDWIDANGVPHRYKCGLNPDPKAVKHMVNYCTCEHHPESTDANVARDTPTSAEELRGAAKFDDPEYHKSLLGLAADEIERLTEELAQWRTWGVIEVAIRNPNVSSYMDEWEGRATKAEAERDRLRGDNEILRHDVAVFRAELLKWNIHGWWDAKTSPVDSQSGTESNP